MNKIDKIGRGAASISRKASRALKKAAMARDQMEHQWDRMFGKNSLRGSPLDASRAREKAEASNPTNFFTDNRKKDQGVKKERYFGDLNKDKLVSADMDGKDEGVQQDKFFGKSGKKKKEKDFF